MESNRRHPVEGDDQEVAIRRDATSFFLDGRPDPAIRDPGRFHIHMRGFGLKRTCGLLLAVFLGVGCIGEEAPTASGSTLVRIGEMAPDFTVGMYDGGIQRLSELRGGVVLLIFFSTWCPECRSELTVIRDSVIERFAGRDFHLLCISRGETREALAVFRAENGFRFPMGLDPDASIYGMYATSFVPRNFLLDASGRIVALTVGYEPGEFELLLAEADRLLVR